MIALLIIFVLLGRKPADVVYHMKISYSESLLVILDGSLPNGLRYPLVGGTRQRHFNGTNFKPHKLPENAQTPTSWVHALLARF